MGKKEKSSPHIEGVRKERSGKGIKHKGRDTCSLLLPFNSKKEGGEIREKEGGERRRRGRIPTIPMIFSWSKGKERVPIRSSTRLTRRGLRLGGRSQLVISCMPS
jgi:hypothetical protein